jgi:ParB-like chromosome segregation protein Spo0J
MLNLVDIPLTSLVPAEKNPNVMSPEKFQALVSAIDQAGFLQPILVSPIGDGTYKIIDGHHRVLAAQSLGMPSLPAVVDAMDDEWQRVMRIGMNRNRGEPDLALVATDIEFLTKSGWSLPDLSITGFTEEELQLLLENVNAVDADKILEGGAGGGLPSTEPATEPTPDLVDLVIGGFTKKEATAARKRLKKLGAGDMKDGLLAAIEAGEEVA